MSKNIEKCYKCLEDYCASCTYAGSCIDCGEETCGEEPCLVECDRKNGCGEQVCKSCQKDHDCTSEEDEDDVEDDLPSPDGDPAT